MRLRVYNIKAKFSCHCRGTRIKKHLFARIKTKMAEQRESRTATVVPPDTQDVQFLSDSYDALVQSKTNLEEDLGRFSRRLDLLEKNFDRIDKAIDDI